MSFILFEDIVEVQRVDDKQFNKVARCHCKSDNFDLEIRLDVNTSVYRVAVEDRLNLALASSLSLDEKPDDGQYDQSRNKSTLLDDYEYCCFGKVFKHEQSAADGKLVVCVSFGGLLCSISGDARHIALELDSRVYLLLRKVK